MSSIPSLGKIIANRFSIRGGCPAMRLDRHHLREYCAETINWFHHSVFFFVFVLSLCHVQSGWAIFFRSSH